jgi:hypothetical protein
MEQIHCVNPVCCNTMIVSVNQCKGGIGLCDLCIENGFTIQTQLGGDAYSFGISYNLLHKDQKIATFAPHNTWLRTKPTPFVSYNFHIKCSNEYCDNTSIVHLDNPIMISVPSKYCDRCCSDGPMVQPTLPITIEFF